MTDFETTSVVICGCGPTGALLSAYLSRMSVQHVVLEKDTAITTDPRGIALDEDGIRLLQGVGIYDKIYTQIGACMEQFHFIGGSKKALDQRPFLQMDYATTEGGTGHVGFICHKQPVLEKCLREAMDGSCDLRPGCSVYHLLEDTDWTYCYYRDSEGNAHRIRSRFFVGADGKTGFTRKNYLEPLGVHMEFADRAFYDETWVALNWEITLPTEKSHPKFPLWDRGYTPEQVYDLFFPVNFRFLCNSERPAVCGRFGLPKDRLWRFEFVVGADEDGEEMAQKEMVMKVVFPYITHTGSRYGLSHDVQFPEDCIRVLRSRPFRFSARSCNRWSHGRVVLCGDAAHVFPPFGGQGIASGFRDAASLAWRLALLCRPQRSHTTNSHEKILQDWYHERKQQLEKSLASTVENGRFVTSSSSFMILFCTCLFFILQLVPQWRRELRLGRRKGGMVRYSYSQGMPFLPEHCGGLCLPQGYCTPVTPLHSNKRSATLEEVEYADGVIHFTDDIIFAASNYFASQRLFRLLVYLQSINELPGARQAVSDIEDISRGELCAGDVTFLVEDSSDMSALQDNDCGGITQAQGVYRLVTGPEFAASPLCKNRPEPRFYDPHYIGKVLGWKKYVILRPDRFVFAAVDNRKDLKTAAAAAVAYLQG